MLIKLKNEINIYNWKTKWFIKQRTVKTFLNKKYRGAKWNILTVTKIAEGIMGWNNKIGIIKMHAKY